MKIVVIGGGSAYMASFFAELIAVAPHFSDTEFALVDIDSYHLDLICRLGQHMLQAANIGDIQITQWNTLDEALSGASIIFTTFRPGGLEARYLDESIAVRYSVIGQETTGPGGLFMACRSIPVMLDIATKARQHCPNAIILNYTNPSSLVTAAVMRSSDMPIIGMCDQHVGERYRLAEYLQIAPDVVHTTSYGLNHATWVVQGSVGNEDVFTYLTSNIAPLGVPTAEELAASLTLFEIYGVLPTTYLRYYYFQRETLQKQRQAATTRAEDIMRSLPTIWTSYEACIEQQLPRPAKQRGGSDHGEFALRMMIALHSEMPQLHNVIVQNDGYLPDFAPHTIVEMPAYISKAGVQPLEQPPLPGAVTGLLRAIESYENLAVEAALTGSYSTLLKAMIAHPLVGDASLARALVDELLRAHAQYLPQFA